MISSAKYLGECNTDMSQNAGTGWGSRAAALPFVLIRNSAPHPWLNSINCNLNCNLCCVCLQGRSVYWPLHAVGESRAVVGSGGVVPTHSIQEVVVRRHTHPSSPLSHGSTHAPLVGVRIEALHRPQTRAAVSTTDCKQSEELRENGSESQTSNMHKQQRSSSHQLSDICKNDDRTVTMWQVL